MNKKNLFYIVGFFIVIAVIAWGAAFALAKPNFIYNYNANGLIVRSNDFDPKMYFAELGNSTNFIVSPEMHETVSADDHSVFGAANIFSVVLTGNKKAVVMLVRVLDSGNSLAYCMTNKGSLQVSEKVSKEQCLAYLDSNSAVKIMVDYPSESFQIASAFLEKDRITIRTNSASNIGNSAFVVSAIMYENTEEIISKSNDIVGSVLSGGVPKVN
ncbi:MAG: hypothetical protein PHD95_04040 [Candidatus ainarchaeum sp.]|nr:hypothetical protein [Candidatus ainarchaeum sp.]